MGAAVGANQMAVQMLKWVAETLQLNDQAKAMLAAQAMTAFQGWPLTAPQPPGFGQPAAA